MLPAKPQAQELTTQGTQFWVALMTNWLVTDVDEYYITASAPRNCTVTVTNPQSGWSHTLTVTANNLTTYQLPAEQCWQPAQFAVTDKGLRIDATDTVQIWIFNQSGTPSSCDATQILPTSALGSDYIVQSTPVEHCSTHQESHSQFSVLATEDSTIVDVTLSSPTASGIASGTTVTRTLQAGQVLQVQGPLTSGDFSGTLVKARECKKIALFSGASITNMPDRGYLGPGGRQYWPGETFEDTLFTQMGCDSIIHISVMPIIDSTCQYHVWTPNIFTPLLGSNNRFRVISDNVTQMNVSIFYRWGDWVCTFDGLAESWDGTHNGTPCPKAPMSTSSATSPPVYSTPNPLSVL